jgi:tRNA(Ile)-lysidine synthase
LRGLLRASGISWIEDPSNRDVRYTRARIRASLAGDPGRVASLLKMAAENGVRLAAIRNDAQERLARAGCSLHAGGAISLDLSALGCGAAAAEAFRSILPIVSGRVPSVGDVPIMNLLCRGSGTIAGAVLWPQGGLGWVGREAARMQPPGPASDWSLWDGRLRLGPGVPDGLRAGPVGDDDATVLRRRHGIAVPHRALAAVPCLRWDGRIAAVPGLGFGRPVPTLPVRRLPAAVVAAANT